MSSQANSENPPIPSHNNDASDFTTQRKKRTAKDIAEEKMKREAKRTAREKERKEKDEETRRKQAEKAVRLELARRAKVEKTPRFTWTPTATEELVQLVSHLKFEHDSVLEVNPGFISWGNFLKENAARKEAFETLKNVAFDALDRRYKAICTTYKAVCDICAETGGAGMLTQLAKYNMSQSVYDALWNLHKDNDAMNAVGGADISDINDLTNGSWSPYMSDSVGAFHLSDSDSEGGEVTPLSKSQKQGSEKPPEYKNKIARNKGKSKGTGIDEGFEALMRMQVESQERMEKWSMKLEAQREKTREDRDARRAEHEGRLEMMNVMMMTMLAKMSGMDMSQFNSQAK